MVSVNNYYLTLVFKNDLEEKERKVLLDDIKKRVLGADKALTVKEDNWGARDLTYPIIHQTKGYYVHMELETEPKNVKGIDKYLNTQEDILRYLLVRR